jgi:succinoglycan biosynthesis transport protein ExoP
MPSGPALAVFRRRKWLALLVFLVPAAAVTGATRTMPSIYESTANLLVEHQQVADRLVGSSDADLLETRLRTISQKILSREQLLQLIAQYNLYPDLRARMPADVAVDRMRKDLRLEFKTERDTSGRDSTTAINLSYRGRDPELVAAVANAVATLFVEENVRIRDLQAAGATAFLQSQVHEADRQLTEQERLMNAFRVSHLGELPEQQASNLAALGRLNEQLRVLNDQERGVLERRDALTRPTTVLLPGATAPVESPEARLTRLRTDLAALRAKYTDEYPEIVRTKEEIAGLERRLAAQRGGPLGEAESTAREPQTALAQVDVELAVLRSQEELLRRSIAVYEQRVQNAPRMEGELQRLAGGYTAAKERHAALVQRFEEAQLKERMQQLGIQQFRILDSALPSPQPVAPHRFRILLMGLAVSAAAAVGAVLLAEAYSVSFHTVDDLRAFTRVPVLVSIPPIVTAADARRNHFNSALAVVGAALSTVTIALASAYLARGNDLLGGLLAPGKF